MTTWIGARLMRVVSAVGVIAIVCGSASGAVVGASPEASTPVATPEGPVVVTMEVVDETFRVLLTEPEDVAGAWSLFAGEVSPSIPNGRIVYGDGGVNAPWHWQLDPRDFEWADMTTEVCDGKPSDVEAHLVTSDRYCPWMAPVLEVVPATWDASPPPSAVPDPSPRAVATFPVFRTTMSQGWTLLDALRPSITDPQETALERIALEGPIVATALEDGLGSLLPDICYLDAWRLEWLVAVDLRLVADLWSAGQMLYAEAAAERLAMDLAAADEALSTVGCD